MLLNRFILPGIWSQGRRRVSHVPREPRCAFALVSDPGRTSAPAFRALGFCPRRVNNEGSSNSLFRGSITGLQHELFTLRAATFWRLRKTRFRGWPAFPGGVQVYPLSSDGEFWVLRSAPLPGLVMARSRSTLSRSTPHPEGSNPGIEFGTEAKGRQEEEGRGED